MKFYLLFHASFENQTKRTTNFQAKNASTSCCNSSAVCISRYYRAATAHNHSTTIIYFATPEPRLCIVQSHNDYPIRVFN